MRALLENIKGRIFVVTEHRGEKIEWEAGIYKTQFRPDFDLFEHLNQFWQHISPAEADHIFNLYRRIHDVMESGYEVQFLIVELIPEITELLNAHNFERVRMWWVYHTNIQIPEAVPAEYIGDLGRPGSREKTYIKSDYKDLITMTLILRAMVPVWGRFLEDNKTSVGNPFKEQTGLQLIGASDLFTSPAMAKLATYISSNVPNNRDIEARSGNINWQRVVVAGVGREDFDRYLLALTVIRKVIINDIRGHDANTSMVSYIYSFITSKMKNGDPTNREDTIQLKHIDRSGDNSRGSGNADGDGTYLENVQVQSAYTFGDTLAYEHFCATPLPILMRLCPEQGNAGLLNAFRQSLEWLGPQDLLNCQVLLTKYIMHPVVSPRAVNFLTRNAVMNLIAVAQSYAWLKGYPFIAAILSAKMTDVEGGGFQRVRLDPELIERLNGFYPYQTVKGKDRSVNPATAALDSLEKDFARSSWIFNLPETMLSAVLGSSPNRGVSCPPDFRSQLTKLIIEINAH